MSGQWRQRQDYGRKSLKRLRFVYLRLETEKKGRSKIKYQILQDKMSQTLLFTLLCNTRIKECTMK